MEDINSFFTLGSVSKLGPDTDPRSFNDCMRGYEVVDYLAKRGNRMRPVIKRPVVGDGCVRKLLRSAVHSPKHRSHDISH